MKHIINHDDYRKSLYITFGKFPFLLLGLVGIIMLAFGMVGELYKTGTIALSISSESLATVFFRSVLGTVAVFYIARITADRLIKGSEGLTMSEEEGYFLPCMSHIDWKDMTYGNLMFANERVYFQPDRQYHDKLDFDYKSTKKMTVELSEPKKSLGLYLITGLEYMMVIRDEKGVIIGRFIVADIEKNMTDICTKF